jgi:ABC-2 type transport system permease protein
VSSPLLTLTRVESSLLLREPAAVLFTLALPLLLLSLNGSQGNAPDPELGGAGLVDVLVPGYLVYVMATSSLMTLAETLADYRTAASCADAGQPPAPWQVLGSHALTHLAMSLLGCVLLVGAGLAAFDLRLPADVPATLLAVLASALAVLSIGFLLGAVLPTVRTTQAVAAALYFPSIFISGACSPARRCPSCASGWATCCRSPTLSLRPRGVDRWDAGRRWAGRAGAQHVPGHRRRTAVVPLGVGGAVPASPQQEDAGAADAADRLMPVWHALLAGTVGLPAVLTLTAGGLPPRDRLVVLGLVAVFAVAYWAVVVRHPEWWETRLLPLAAYWLLACSLVVGLARVDDSFSIVLYGVVPLMFITLGWWAMLPILGLTAAVGLALGTWDDGPAVVGNLVAQATLAVVIGAFVQAVARQSEQRRDASRPWRPPASSSPSRPGTPAPSRSASGCPASCTTRWRSPSPAW